MRRIIVTLTIIATLIGAFAVGGWAADRTKNSCRPYIDYGKVGLQDDIDEGPNGELLIVGHCYGIGGRQKQFVVSVPEWKRITFAYVLDQMNQAHFPPTTTTVPPTTTTVPPTTTTTSTTTTVPPTTTTTTLAP